jgi:hypothetical protein
MNDPMMTPGANRSVAALRREFQRQAANLVSKGYPQLAGLAVDAFERIIAPLQERLPELAPSEDAAHIPFVIVIGQRLVARHLAVAQLERRGRRGFTQMEADDLERFAPIERVALPTGSAYLAADLDSGRATRNVTPDAALERLVQEGRSPLTIDEGIALVTHYPDVLETGSCFSTLGSRCGDRRVPALWISGGRPRLGWCWAGNPHSWLGSASCGGRVGSQATLTATARAMPA